MKKEKVLTDFAPPEAEAVLDEPYNAEPPCLLDDLAAPAKVVVVLDADSKKHAICQSGAGVHELPEDDVARGLPVAARIFKKADRVEATHLEMPERAPLIAKTAREAIAQFRDYVR